MSSFSAEHLRCWPWSSAARRMRLRYGSRVHPRSRRPSSVRVLGNVALLAGFLTSVITLSADFGDPEVHILAGLLVALGVGLRLEAAITDASLK